MSIEFVDFDEIDEKLTEILKVKARPNFQKDDENMNRTSGVSK